MSTYNFENQNSKSFYNMAWIAFVLSFVGMAAGLIYLQAEAAIKGFFAMAYLFSVSSCFTLAKVIRDRHENEKSEQKIDNAKNERFFADHSAAYPSA